MSRKGAAFISFSPSDGGFRAFMSLEGVMSDEIDLDHALPRAEEVYRAWISRMRPLVEEIRAARISHKLIPARTVWQLGNAIFQLTHDLVELRLQVDGLYDHLMRDLGVKRKWLEKVVIFRRYLPSEGLVPEGLNWGRCEKGTRRVAERLRDNHSVLSP